MLTPWLSPMLDSPIQSTPGSPLFSISPRSPFNSPSPTLLVPPHSPLTPLFCTQPSNATALPEDNWFCLDIQPQSLPPPPQAAMLVTPPLSFTTQSPRDPALSDDGFGFRLDLQVNSLNGANEIHLPSRSPSSSSNRSMGQTSSPPSPHFQARSVSPDRTTTHRNNDDGDGLSSIEDPRGPAYREYYCRECYLNDDDDDDDLSSMEDPRGPVPRGYYCRGCFETFISYTLRLCHERHRIAHDGVCQESSFISRVSPPHLLAIPF